MLISHPAWNFKKWFERNVTWIKIEVKHRLIFGTTSEDILSTVNCNTFVILQIFDQFLAVPVCCPASTNEPLYRYNAIARNIYRWHGCRNQNDISREYKYLTLADPRQRRHWKCRIICTQFFKGTPLNPQTASHTREVTSTNIIASLKSLLL